MKNTIMFAALAVLKAEGFNKSDAAQRNEASPGGLAQLKIEAQFIDEVGNWFEGAAQDIGEWTVGAGEDIAEFTIDLGEDIEDWMIDAG